MIILPGTWWHLDTLEVACISSQSLLSAQEMLPGLGSFCSVLPIIEAWGDSGNLPGDKSTAAKRNFERRGAFLEPSVDSGQELEPSSCRWRVFGSRCDSLEVFYIFLFVVNERAVWSLIGHIKCTYILGTVSLSQLKY